MGITFQVPAAIPYQLSIQMHFAAQGRTELSLQRAALDSATAARGRCSLDHGDE